MIESHDEGLDADISLDAILAAANDDDPNFDPETLLKAAKDGFFDDKDDTFVEKFLKSTIDTKEESFLFVEAAITEEGEEEADAEDTAGDKVGDEDADGDEALSRELAELAEALAASPAGAPAGSPADDTPTNSSPKWIPERPSTGGDAGAEAAGDLQPDSSLDFDDEIHMDELPHSAPGPPASLAASLAQPKSTARDPKVAIEAKTFSLQGAVESIDKGALQQQRGPYGSNPYIHPLLNMQSHLSSLYLPDQSAESASASVSAALHFSASLSSLASLSVANLTVVGQATAAAAAAAIGSSLQPEHASVKALPAHIRGPLHYTIKPLRGAMFSTDNRTSSTDKLASIHRAALNAQPSFVPAGEHFPHHPAQNQPSFGGQKFGSSNGSMATLHVPQHDDDSGLAWPSRDLAELSDMESAHAHFSGSAAFASINTLPEFLGGCCAGGVVGAGSVGEDAAAAPVLYGPQGCALPPGTRFRAAGNREFYTYRLKALKASRGSRGSCEPQNSLGSEAERGRRQERERPRDKSLSPSPPPIMMQPKWNVSPHLSHPSRNPARSPHRSSSPGRRTPSPPRSRPLPAGNADEVDVDMDDDPPRSAATPFIPYREPTGPSKLNPFSLPIEAQPHSHVGGRDGGGSISPVTNPEDASTARSHTHSTPLVSADVEADAASSVGSLDKASAHLEHSNSKTHRSRSRSRSPSPGQSDRPDGSDDTDGLLPRITLRQHSQSSDKLQAYYKFDSRGGRHAAPGHRGPHFRSDHSAAGLATDAATDDDNLSHRSEASSRLIQQLGLARSDSDAPVIHPPLDASLHQRFVAPAGASYQVHSRVMGWKLTSPQRRRELVGLLDMLAAGLKKGHRVGIKVGRSGVRGGSVGTFREATLSTEASVASVSSTDCSPRQEDDAYLNPDPSRYTSFDVVPELQDTAPPTRPNSSVALNLFSAKDLQQRSSAGRAEAIRHSQVVVRQAQGYSQAVQRHIQARVRTQVGMFAAMKVRTTILTCPVVFTFRPALNH